MPRQAVKPNEIHRDNFLWTVESYLDRSLQLPDILEFALSDKYLNRAIYPAQGTILKILFLQDELFTEWDKELIGTWVDTYKRTELNGCSPDIYERIKICKEQDRPWFREVVMAIGRRGSKGYIGAIATAYILWHYILKGSPQQFFGIDRDKQLGFYVFAGQKLGAIQNLWGDIANVVKGAPIFAPYLPQRSLAESLLLFAPHDFVRIQDREEMGMKVRPEEMASFRIDPKESTLISGRGPALFGIGFDEMAWVTRQTAKASSDEIYQQVTPALDTFKKWAWIYEPSTTWEMTGKFYENYNQSLQISDGKDGRAPGTIVYPEMIMFQLCSWDPYVQWNEAQDIPLRPHNTTKQHAFTYPAQQNSQQDYDEEMRKLEERNPEAFAVERRSHWASVLEAYLSPARIEQMFDAWPTHEPMNLGMKAQGKLSETYLLHCDPSYANHRFGLALAHLVNPRGSEFPHVVFDVIHYWDPADQGGHIDYERILHELKEYIYFFQPSEVTFDQGYSAWLLQQLSKWTSSTRFAKHISVFQRTATARSNWDTAEVFKTCLNMNLIHAPYHEELKNELMFLQLLTANKVGPPTAGPVQTDDIADAVMAVVYAFMAKHIGQLLGKTFMAAGVQGSQAGGLPLAPQVPDAQSASGEMLNRQRINASRTRFDRQTNPARTIRQDRQQHSSYRKPNRFGK